MAFSGIAARLLKAAKDETNPLLKKAALRLWLDYLNKLLAVEKKCEEKREQAMVRAIAKCWRKPQRVMCQDRQQGIRKQKASKR